MRGTLKWYNREKRYGFIIPDDGSPDVFFHHTAIIDLTSTRRIYELYQTPILLTYTLRDDKDRPHAKTVQAL